MRTSCKTADAGAVGRRRRLIQHSPTRPSHRWLQSAWLSAVNLPVPARDTQSHCCGRRQRRLTYISASATRRLCSQLHCSLTSSRRRSWGTAARCSRSKSAHDSRVQQCSLQGTTEWRQASELSTERKGAVDSAALTLTLSTAARQRCHSHSLTLWRTAHRGCVGRITISATGVTTVYYYTTTARS